MRKKKIWRYYCDFCKKANCSGGSIKKHESRCTLNPDRYCGFCHLLEQDQPDLQKAIKLLPKPDDFIEIAEEGYGKCVSYDKLQAEVKKALPALRDLVGNCPACILAALRQAGIPVPLAADFDFKKESASVWADFNEANQEQEPYPC